MSKDLHEKPFDEETIVKLEIFEEYAQEWIPTFVMQGASPLWIFDFFAGTGYDINGVPGSPIRILEKISEQIMNAFHKRVRFEVVFNEFDPQKCKKLKDACAEYLKNNAQVDQVINLQILNEDFDACFFRFLAIIQKETSLIYLDQNGVRFLSDKYLLELEKTMRTDFLSFVSSSYFLRFGHLEEFRQYIAIDMELAKKDPYQHIHRNILGQLRSKLPASTKLRLYPFSLKKGANIYGIIFGATHPRAVDKFLKVAWKRNPVNGEANWDIDDDKGKKQLDLFLGQKLTKIEAFQGKLREEVLSGRVSDNAEALNFTFAEGHIGAHAADELRKMKQEKLIDFDGTYPLVTYEKVYKEGQILIYKLLKR